MITNFPHFYARYGLAVALEYAEVSTVEEITLENFKDLLELGLMKFRVAPVGSIDGNEITYDYVSKEKGDPSKGVFLNPTMIVSDMGAKNLWTKLQEFIEEITKSHSLEGRTKAAQSFAPTAGEFNNGNASKRSADISLVEALCCAITTSTSNKPAYAQLTVSGGKPSYSNTAIIPDFEEVEDMRKFIKIFKVISKVNKLMIGKVSIESKSPVLNKTDNSKTGEDKNDIKVEEKGKRKLLRPKIFNGNFPHAPRSNNLYALALLGAIGVWARESEETKSAEEVLKKLEDCPIYIINAESTRIVRYNHYVVTLAREGYLGEIIDSVYHTRSLSLNSKSDFKEKDREREKIAFFASRFLHLFDSTSFKEFLAIRAEYPNKLEILFKTFFMETKKIDPEWVASARELGAWLNQIAYFVAKENTKKEPLKVYDEKAKILVELESSAFSAKSGCALIYQTLTRAGRLSKREAPLESALFIEKTISGELDLKSAQQMLMAFSRLKSKNEPKGSVKSQEDADTGGGDDKDDYSDAQ
ncbi:MAG: type CRISPR-associated protein Cas8c/Csp2 [Bacteroidota bacterium]|jgi:hypothetical protein